jgi:hypothetical protein
MLTNRESIDSAGGPAELVIRGLFREHYRDAVKTVMAGYPSIGIGSAEDVAQKVMMVSRHPVLIDPDLFRPLAIEVKETNTLAWVRLASGGPQGVKTIRPIVSPSASRCSPAGTSSSPSRWLTSGLIAPSATSLVSRAWQSLMS